LLLPSRTGVVSPLAAQFVPVFWNPVMFPNQPGTMGAMIDPRHPVFADFPTDPWTNWQWWELLNHSFAMNLETVSTRVTMPCGSWISLIVTRCRPPFLKPESAKDGFWFARSISAATSKLELPRVNCAEALTVTWPAINSNRAPS